MRNDLLAWFSFLAFALLGESALLAGSLDEGLDQLARTTTLFLKDRNRDSIFVDPIRFPRSSAGRLVVHELRKKLENAGIRSGVDPLDAEFRLTGEMSVIPDLGVPVVVMNFSLYDNDSNVELRDFSQHLREVFTEEREFELETIQSNQLNRENSSVVNGQKPNNSSAPIQRVAPETIIGSATGPFVDDPDNFLRITGVTVDILGGISELTGISSEELTTHDGNLKMTLELRGMVRHAKDQSIANAYATRQFARISPAVIASGEGSPFALSLEVAEDRSDAEYVPIPVESRNGIPFAGLRDGQRYRVRIRNDSQHEVAVAIAVDGINTLELSENAGFRQLGKLIIAPKSTGVIAGWYTDANTVEPFVVRSEFEGILSQLPPPMSLGMVSATFYPVWEEETSKPPIESLLAGNTRSSPNLSTAAAATEVPVPQSIVRRSVGLTPLESISVMYRNPDPPLGIPD